MSRKLFHRLSYLLCLFQISCFVALPRIPLHSSSLSSCSDEDKKIDVFCDRHSEKLEIEPKDYGSELLVYGFIRQFEPKAAREFTPAREFIPDGIKRLCVDFSRRLLLCDCIKKKYKKILSQLDIDENRKKAFIFFLMYKIEDEEDKLKRITFHSACKGGQLGLAKLLKERGTNINMRNEKGNNVLHEACASSDSVAMVTWLLDVCKIDIEIKGQDKKTPFLFAAGGGQLEIAKELRKRGANIKEECKYRDNALHYACTSSDSVDMVAWLLDVCGIHKETKGFNQKTPFLFAY